MNYESGPRSLKLLGFVPKSAIPRYHYVDTPLVLVANKDSELSCKAFAALVHAMHDYHRTGTGGSESENDADANELQLAVMRLVQRDNAIVKLYAGVPVKCTENAPAHLLMVHLPYKEDLRYNFAFRTFNEEGRGPTVAGINAAYDLIVSTLCISWDAMQ